MYQDKLGSYYVCNLPSGGIEVTYLGLLDEGTSGVYSSYEDLPEVIRLGLAVLNMLPQAGNLPDVGTRISDHSYFIIQHEQ